MQTMIPRALRASIAALFLATGFPGPGMAAPHPQGSPEASTLPEDSATRPRMRLVSQAQYANTLAYVFGPDISVSTHFAPFARTDGLLASGAAAAGVTLGQMQEFQRTAAAVAAQVVGPEHRNFLLPCAPRDPSKADAACARQFLLPVARLLQRREPTRATADRIVAQAGEAATRLGDFHAGLGIALEGLLIAPETLFVVDRVEPDPGRPGRQRLDSYSLASRLSFFLWNAAPDDALLKAAERGELQTAKGLSRVIDRMLASPRLETGVRAFFDDMLRFDDLAVVAKDPAIYPAFTGETLEDAREQTLRTIVDHLLVQQRDYRDLFTTRETFISPALAVLYGVPAPPGWTHYTSPEGSQRVGLLTQVSFLSAHAHPGRSSVTLRGKALREKFLCQKVPRPPPNVDFSLIENPNAALKTAREKLAAHRANPVCAGCHKITDPIGLALENFDGAAQFRTTEHGQAIDPSGTLDGKPFEDVVGLASVLHENRLLGSCLVKRVYAYGTGGPVAPGDKAVLTWFEQRFSEDGYRLPELLREIAASEVFASVAVPAVAAKTVDSPDSGLATAVAGDTSGASR